MKRPSLITVILILLAIVVGFITYFVSRETVTQPLSDEQRAIQAAEAFTPDDKDCVKSETAAIHKSTGAAYTFDSQCLPTGWDATISDQPVKDGDDPVSSDGNSSNQPVDNPPIGDPPQVVPPVEPTEPANPGPTTLSQEEALRQARNYRPKGACITVMTPARHIESGATYTFNSGCIPSGWERISSGEEI